MTGEDHTPDHVRGWCDIGGCDAIANWAYSDGETYLEVCAEHATNLGSQFDSDYERVQHDSPHRATGPRERIAHGCGGEILVYSAPDGGEHRVCTGCSYAMVLSETEEGTKVAYTDAVEE